MMLWLIFLLVAGCLLTALILLRYWLLKQRGIDVEEEAVPLETVGKRLKNSQMLILLLLVLPSVIFLVASFIYLLASVSASA